MSSLQLPQLDISVSRGLTNEGCTCYLNSLLQVFYHINPFRIFISSIRLPSDSNSPSLNSLSALQDVFNDLSYVFRPFVSARRWIQCQQTPDGKAIDVDKQEDAHEYLNIFLQQIESICETADLPNVVHDLFESAMRIQLKCPDCGVIGNSQEVFNCLSVDVKGFDSLEESLDHLLEIEDIESYHCEKCRKLVTLKKMSSFSHFAPYLFVHLKRFQFDPHRMQREKIGDFFSFGETLTLREASSEEPSTFHLKAIITHAGDADGGHYMSYIQENGTWMEFNDQEVTVCNDPQAMFVSCYGVDFVCFWIGE